MRKQERGEKSDREIYLFSLTVAVPEGDAKIRGDAGGQCGKGAMTDDTGEVTQHLKAWAGGDREALNRMMPLVYQELRKIARRVWRGQDPQNTLQPTALIHEAYVKLAAAGVEFQDRNHFYAVASVAMRQVLVNHAQANLAGKRGGGQVRVPLDDVQASVQKESEQVLALHESLERLEKLDARKCRVVEFIYFGGFGMEETAEALGISSRTVTREWQAARVWLARDIGFGPITK
jgi:RNA polymerase sigma-70 factor (ECF subfamily)